MPEEPSSYDGILSSAEWICESCGRPRSAHEPCVSGFVRKKYDIVGMMRIKNEARWIVEVMESIRDLCDVIYILDDHSTDGTQEMCLRYHNVKLIESPFVGMNESRDKNWLYDQIIREAAPNWILCIDGDEIMEKAGPKKVRDTIANNPFVNAYKLKIEYMWGAKDKVRTDRIYGDFWRPSLFRPFHEDPGTPDSLTLLKEFRFMATPFGRVRGNNKPNLHCSSVPQRLLHQAQNMPVRLKHYGYMTRESRVAKLDYYTSIDWKNASEDCYRHMCQGDDVKLAELPRIQELMKEGLLTQADVDFLLNVKPQDKLVHAGPIVVDKWDESKPWTMSEWARKQ